MARRNLTKSANYLTAATVLGGVAAAAAGVQRRLTSRIEETYSQRFEAIIHNSPDFVFVIEADGSMSYMSPAAKRLLGDSVTHVNQLLAMLRDDHAELVAAAVVEPSLAPDAVVLPVRAGDGRTRRIEFRLSNERENPAVRALVVTGRDVTEQVELQAELARHAHIDELTDLPNRRAINKALGEAASRSQRNGSNLGFILLDLDGFKGVNDTLGHPTGDDLLRQVAQRLRDEVRAGELVGRLGGDEFAVIVEGISDATQARDAATRFTMALKSPFQVEEQLLALGVSGGLVTSNGHTDETELVRLADIALYEAKSRGRGRIEVFEAEMEELLVNQERLKREIEAGIARSEFSLAYQPLLTVDEQEIVGFEALMRWESPALGTVSPVTFIPVCERTGMIRKLGRWALEEACTQLVRWQAEHDNPALSMSVNVSVVQLGEGNNFVPALQEILHQTGVAPETLQLEVTESVIAASIDEVIAELAEIRELGVRIALDDFGTGYSSMSQLQLLPVDCIKIDRSFIQALRGDDEQAAMVVNALVELGKALGLKVIAEGVEELDQLAALMGPQCDLAQGFLLGKPMPATEVSGFLDQPAASFDTA